MTIFATLFKQGVLAGKIKVEASTFSLGQDEPLDFKERKQALPERYYHEISKRYYKKKAVELKEIEQ